MCRKVYWTFCTKSHLCIVSGTVPLTCTIKAEPITYPKIRLKYGPKWWKPTAPHADIVQIISIYRVLQHLYLSTHTCRTHTHAHTRVHPISEHSDRLIYCRSLTNIGLVLHVSCLGDCTFNFDCLSLRQLLTGNSPIVSCEKECSDARDEGIYEWIRLRRLFVVSSRHLVLARKQTLKILENAVSDTLLTSGFQVFAADAPCDFFSHPTKKYALSFPDFCQKPKLNLAVEVSVTMTQCDTTDICMFMTFTFSQSKVIDWSC